VQCKVTTNVHTDIHQSGSQTSDMNKGNGRYKQGESTDRHGQWKFRKHHMHSSRNPSLAPRQQSNARTFTCCGRKGQELEKYKQN